MFLSSAKHQIAFLEETILLCRTDEGAFRLADVVLRGPECIVDSGFQLGVGDWLVRLEPAGNREGHFGGEMGSLVEDVFC